MATDWIIFTSLSDILTCGILVAVVVEFVRRVWGQTQTADQAELIVLSLFPLSHFEPCKPIIENEFDCKFVLLFSEFRFVHQFIGLWFRVGFKGTSDCAPQLHVCLISLALRIRLQSFSLGDTVKHVMLANSVNQISRRSAREKVFLFIVKQLVKGVFKTLFYDLLKGSVIVKPMRSSVTHWSCVKQKLICQQNAGQSQRLICCSLWISKELYTKKSSRQASLNFTTTRQSWDNLRDKFLFCMWNEFNKSQSVSQGRCEVHEMCSRQLLPYHQFIVFIQWTNAGSEWKFHT